MGFSFVSAEERNPTNQTPTPAVDPCAEIQAQLDEVNQFIDENNLLKNFYLWQELKAQMYDTSAEVIEDTLTLGDVASLENEQ
jgi:hypothetical protein